MKKHQKAIHKWVSGYAEPYWHPLSQYARLVEEVGELGRLLNHKYGSKVKKKDEKEEDLGGELADIIFTVICFANSHKIDLDKEMDKVLEKSRTRDKDRYAKKK